MLPFLPLSRSEDANDTTLLSLLRTIDNFQGAYSADE